MDRQPKIMLVITLASILVLALVMAGCSSPTSTQSAQIGKPAPDFKLSNLEGQSVSLSDFRGRPVLLNFWASWCGPCRYEMPFIQEIHEKWSAKGLVVLTVNLQEDPSLVKEFMEDLGLSFPVLLATNQEVSLAYNLRGIPTTFFIDKDGIIQDRKVGAFTGSAEIESRLIKIMP
ncbi:MAG: TlpA family protein disulfide reductase [Dehalococcoidales bacterium]